MPASAAAIEEAAEALRRGELVVIPTETVYGLACDAPNPEALRRTFAAKGRPADHPLIAHVQSVEQARSLARDWPPCADVLSRRFWPGPLTVVVPRGAGAPTELVGGLDTVAIRSPNHSVALAIIKALGRPVAAPSANPYMSVSPTRVEHLEPGIVAAAALVVDAGPCERGVESTVIDCAQEPPALLRPGAVTRSEIEEVLGVVLADPPTGAAGPGRQARHYAPRTRLILVDALGPDDAGLTFDAPANALQVRLPREPRQCERDLYDALHRLDALGLESAKVALPPDAPEWETVHNRLRKAATL